MTIQEKINDELRSLIREKQEATKNFELCKKLLITILDKCDASTVCGLETNNIPYLDMRKYAQRIEEINTKLRVYEYLIGV